MITEIRSEIPQPVVEDYPADEPRLSTVLSGYVLNNSRARTVIDAVDLQELPYLEDSVSILVYYYWKFKPLTVRERMSKDLGEDFEQDLQIQLTDRFIRFCVNRVIYNLDYEYDRFEQDLESLWQARRFRSRRSI